MAVRRDVAVRVRIDVPHAASQQRLPGQHVADEHVLVPPGNDRLVDRIVAPRDRRVGYVPQDYVLFPTRKVADNIIFGLRERGVKRAAALADVEWVVELLGIGSLLDRWPATLSGGEQQRVALARALAPSPTILLLDEPLSALDARVRVYLRAEIRRIQETLGVTTLMVTHDQEEALTMADRVVVIDEG